MSANAPSLRILESEGDAAAEPAEAILCEAMERAGHPFHFQTFSLTAVDAEGNATGHLHAELFYSHLYINRLAVLPGFRGRGVGSLLLAHAEQVGQARGARVAYLGTWDHQAPAFYARAGYTVFGRLPPVGGHPGKRWMAKNLGSDADGGLFDLLDENTHLVPVHLPQRGRCANESPHDTAGTPRHRPRNTMKETAMAPNKAPRFRTTAIGTYVLTYPDTGGKELGSVIRNRKGRWKATHRASMASTYHATRELAKAWLVTLETTGVDTQKPHVQALDTAHTDVFEKPYIDPTTGATMVPLPGGGVQVIPVPQPLVVWRTALESLEVAQQLARKALDTGLGAHSVLTTIQASFATEEGVLERTEYQIDVTTCADQVPALDQLLVAHTSDSYPAYVVLPVLTAPISYAAWLRRHSAGFAPDAVPQE
jgi:GNAT superfamily N-acetyltransferase/uncharacterized protein involved in tolerance to divalent cations